MPKVKIPQSLQSQWDRIVEILYKGDQAGALDSAIKDFIHQKLKELPSGQKFEHLMEERMVVETDKEGYSNKELSSAMNKLKERKDRLESFDFRQDRKPK